MPQDSMQIVTRKTRMPVSIMTCACMYRYVDVLAPLDDNLSRLGIMARAFLHDVYSIFL